MKNADKEIWPPECLGFSINNKLAYQRAPFLTALRQRSFVDSNAPERGLRAVLMLAEGRGRGKRKRKSSAFLSRHLVLRATFERKRLLVHDEDQDMLKPLLQISSLD